MIATIWASINQQTLVTEAKYRQNGLKNREKTATINEFQLSNASHVCNRMCERTKKTASNRRYKPLPNQSHISHYIPTCRFVCFTAKKGIGGAVQAKERKKRRQKRTFGFRVEQWLGPQQHFVAYITRVTPKKGRIVQRFRLWAGLMSSQPAEVTGKKSTPIWLTVGMMDSRGIGRIHVWIRLDWLDWEAVWIAVRVSDLTLIRVKSIREW